MSKSILLVDDEVDFVSTLAERLNLRGIQAAVADTGQRALQLLQNTTYDRIFLDLGMPGMSGPELFEQIRAQGITTPIIIMSGNPSEYNSSAFPPETKMLSKPVELGELLACLE